MFISEETILNSTPVSARVVDDGGWPGMSVRQFIDEFENFWFTDDELEALTVRF